MMDGEKNFQRLIYTQSVRTPSTFLERKKHAHSMCKKPFIRNHLSVNKTKN